MVLINPMKIVSTNLELASNKVNDDQVNVNKNLMATETGLFFIVELLPIHADIRR